MPDTLSNVGFKFEGIMIERIIAHKIYPHTPDKQLVKPTTSNNLEELPQEALDALQLRITKALGNRSHGIEMSIEQIDSDSYFQNASAMLHADEHTFIELSKNLAHKLNTSQLSTNAPGGVLAIITGRIGNDSLPFIAAIKAEIQDGFGANEKEGQVKMEYLKNLLLTTTQRLYKVGFLVELISKPADPNGHLPGNYRAFLFDHLMTATETRNAAGYFYINFLGMGIQASSKKLTQNFFEWTRTFIDTTPVRDDDKFEFHEALRVELRSKDGTISVSDFGDKHFPDEIRKQYDGFMKTKGFPQNAVLKDNDYIRAKLKKRRKLLLDSDVYISAPPDEFKNLVQIMPSNDAGFTVVKIKGQIKGQD